jgi:thiosulfate/3-mercaptopyruvate sulfurtransferase
MTGWHDSFVSVEALVAGLERGEQPILLDVRFDPRVGALPDDYAEAHLPGAVFVDLPAELAAAPAAGTGRFPLPALEDVQAAARRWGIREGSVVVAYDDRSGVSAARAAWVLRWAGFERVRVLDGGLRAWVAAGQPTIREVPRPVPGDAVLSGGRLEPIGADDVRLFAERGALLDARGAKQFAAGRIPSALSLPATELLDDDGVLRPVDQVRRRLVDLGVPLGSPIAVSCGAGIAATFTALALSALGEEVAVYVGSWSEWTADPARPVERDLTEVGEPSLVS